eukprot:scaffold126155_cov60-Phaeocystis_antarctica.AAC.1
MHVDWPPMVDSGTSGQPVSNCAVASDIAMVGSDGGLSSAADAIAATGAAAPASDEPAGPAGGPLRPPRRRLPQRSAPAGRAGQGRGRARPWPSSSSSYLCPSWPPPPPPHRVRNQ